MLVKGAPGQHIQFLKRMQTSHFWDLPKYVQIELQRIHKDYNYLTLLNILLVDIRISPNVLVLW